MAYFANGSEGAVLDHQCDKCVHGYDDDMLCPVAAVQTIYNYDQVGNENLEAAMKLLVDDKGECQMRKVLKQIGVKFDYSHREQRPLF